MQLFYLMTHLTIKPMQNSFSNLLQTFFIVACLTTNACKDKTKPPDINTKEVTEISYTVATSGGEITNEGGNTIISKGVCWSSSANPTTSDKKTNDGDGTGSFSSSLTQLLPNTFYYVRAYAINDAGTGYGNQVSFATSQVTVPTLATTEIGETTQMTAITGGNISSENGGSVSARGVCWSTVQYPTISDNKTSDGTGSGNFTSTITGLTANTRYYVRAYASNSAGTQYGNELSFTTNQLPTLKTISISSVSTNSCLSGGDIISDGGVSITARGVCWNTSTNPKISDFITSDGAGTGSFISTISGLESNMTYYMRSYVTNSVCTTYGNEVIFKTYYGTVIDNDGNNYYTVKIGSQIWTAENLKTTTYNDGSSIPKIPVDTFLTTPGYCWYNNNEADNKAPYGGLYNWYAVNTAMLCPTGWHIPTQDEFSDLEINLGGANYCAGKLKETDTKHWLSPNQGATNESGFTALPGGHLYEIINGNISNTGFEYIGIRGYWWSSTSHETDNSRAYGINLQNSQIYVTSVVGIKGYCYSIRCIKD